LIAGARILPAVVRSAVVAGTVGADLEHVRAAALLTGNDGVERDASGAPTAFRIWRAGDNPTDHGLHRFTEESARVLMAEQAARGNRYSIDVDHLSLTTGKDAAPPESRKAVGFHRLAVRQGEGGPELWAVDCEWTDVVKAGLQKNPPEWRYYSPAYDVRKKTGEITSYLNTALTNNPATWRVTALANTVRGVRTMDYKEIAAALFGDDDEKKKAAKAAIAAMSDLERKAYKAAWKAAQAAADDGDDKPADDKPAADAKTASEGDPPKDDKKEGEEAARVAATRREADLLATIGTQDRRIADLEARNVATEREQILASRPDLTESQRKTLGGKAPAEIREILALIPAPAPDPAAASKVTATRGQSQTDGGEYGSVRAARLPPEEHADLAQRMGRDPRPKGVHWDPQRPNDLVFPLMGRDEARTILATRARQGKDGPPRKPAHVEGVK
jgi:hypothetical protein